MNQGQSLEDKQNIWHYEDHGERKGGISESEMIDLIKSGKLGYGSVVWRHGFQDWLLLENTELKVHILGPPPLTGSNVSNTLVSRAVNSLQ